MDGDGGPGQLDVRNCSFENLVVSLDGPSGGFRDCTFIYCYIYLKDSPAAFIDCTFLRSAMSIYSPATLHQTRLANCTFDSQSSHRWDPLWMEFQSVPAVGVSGYAALDNCTITGYGRGIESLSGLPAITACRVQDCKIGINLETTDLADTPSVIGCVIRNCTSSGLAASGNLLLKDCTVYNCSEGLLLSRDDPKVIANWTLSGNRIFGNKDYGVLLYRADVPLGDTRFDDGAGHANGEGQVAMYGELWINVSMFGPGRLPYQFLNLTDATGNLWYAYPIGQSTFVSSSLLSFTVDNLGRRQERFPYTVRVAWEGLFCETVIPAGTWNITLRLPNAPDLVPAAVTLDPPAPKGGDYVVISCIVNNTGPRASQRTGALFTLDGARLDLSELYPMDTRSGSTVRAVDWKARPGVHTVTVRLDPDNLLEENDESNNNLTFNFTVAPAPPPAAPAPNTALLGAAAAVVLAAAGAAGWFARRRRKRPGGA